MRAHQRIVRDRQLQPNQERLDPAEQEEGEGGRAVENADPLCGRRSSASSALSTSW